MASKSYQIPFDQDGSVYSYVYDGQQVIWKDNFEFNDKLRVVSCYRGRSAANFRLKSVTTGCTYTMFLKDLTDMMDSVNAVDGVITGKWTFCKKGKNYGIKYLGDK